MKQFVFPAMGFVCPYKDADDRMEATKPYSMWDHYFQEHIPFVGTFVQENIFIVGLFLMKYAILCGTI